MESERVNMIQWLEAHCPLKIEYDFWYQFYDDLDDCFAELEPWRLSEAGTFGIDSDWREWDRKFTRRRIVD